MWAADHLGYSELRKVVAAPPTAELEPIREGIAAQVDCPPLPVAGYRVMASTLVHRTIVDCVKYTLSRCNFLHLSPRKLHFVCCTLFG